MRVAAVGALWRTVGRVPVRQWHCTASCRKRATALDSVAGGELGSIVAAAFSAKRLKMPVARHWPPKAGRQSASTLETGTVNRTAHHPKGGAANGVKQAHRAS